MIIGADETLERCRVRLLWISAGASGNAVELSAGDTRSKLAAKSGTKAHLEREDARENRRMRR